MIQRTLTSPTGIYRASIFAMLVKCTLKASAISSALFIALLLAWISKILDVSQLFRELSSLIRSQVLRGLPLLQVPSLFYFILFY